MNQKSIDNVLRTYESKFGKLPWNLDLTLAETVSLMRSALREDKEVDWSPHLHPYDDWIDQDGNPV